MAQVVWTEPALDDLDEIAEYIALDNVDAAKRLVIEVFRKVERLELHPKSGRVPDELTGSIYREIIVKPCRIFYKIQGKTVYILFVMRSERSLRNYLIDARDG